LYGAAQSHEQGSTFDAGAFEQAIAAAREKNGEQFYPMARRFLLQTIDLLWVEHLEAMEYLRSSVNLRAYGQRDPLVEYKKEGLRLFNGMEANYEAHAIERLPIALGIGAIDQAAAAAQDRTKAAENVRKAARSITFSAAPGGKKYGRNDKVTITNGTTTKEMKFKKAEPFLATGEWKIVE
jgi:preprotein translocase subunit SecA